MFGTPSLAPRAHLPLGQKHGALFALRVQQAVPIDRDAATWARPACDGDLERARGETAAPSSWQIQGPLLSSRPASSYPQARLAPGPAQLAVKAAPLAARSTKTNAHVVWVDELYGGRRG